MGVKRADRSLLKAVVAIARFSRLVGELLAEPRAAQALDEGSRRALSQRYRQLHARARQLLPAVAAISSWPGRPGREGRRPPPSGRPGPGGHPLP